MEELSCLDNFRCNGNHTHEQSRGKPLKSAEGYTFEYTDCIHEAFNRSTSSLRSHRACSALSTEMAAEQQSLAQRQVNFWNLTYSTALYDAAMSTEVSEVAAGMCNDLTPPSALGRYADQSMSGEPNGQSWAAGALSRPS